MSINRDLERVEHKLSELREELTDLSTGIVRARRDEQLEIDRLRRQYDMEITNLEGRQGSVQREITHQERELERLREKIAKTQEEEVN